MQQKSLFERLGGEKTIDETLTRLEDKIKADGTLGPMHQNVDFKKMHENRKAYLINLYGGSAQYNGKPLTEAHKPYDLKDGHYNLFTYLLRQSMTELKLEQTLIDEALLVLEQTRSQVLNKPSLFERLGGNDILSKAMDLLADKISTDSLLGPAYAKTDLNKVNKLRLEYLTELFGGKAEYSGKSMREAHANHGSEASFDRFIYIFEESLSQLKVDAQTIKEAVHTLQTIRPEIVSKASLFNELGGFEGLEKIVAEFHGRVLKDATLAPFFANVDLKKLNENRKHYFAQVFGGPQVYSGKSMRDAHSHQKYDDKTFNLFLRILRQTILDSGIKENFADQAIETLDLTRDEILGRKSLLERLGGKLNLHSIVEKFHQNMSKDIVLAPIYEKADSNRLINGYTNYFVYLFGGSTTHNDQSASQAHRNLQLTSVHFDLFVSIFVKTLNEFKIEKDIVTEATFLIERRRNAILKRESLWVRLGGERFMEKAITIFVQKVVNDPTLKPFHQGVDLKRYHDTHKDFFAQVFGGYYLYAGRNLGEVHSPLKLKDEHFNLFVELFRQSLIEVGLKEDVSKEAVDALELTRNQILNTQSLYDRLGGEQTMELLTEKLNKHLAEDAVLGPLHKNVDWTKLHLHRKQFFTQLFGNLNVYTGKDLRTAHSDLKLNDEHFELFVLIFNTTLTELGINKDLAKEALTHIETTRRDILNSTTLYDKLGGKAAVEKFVVALDDLCIADAKLAPFFEKIDRQKLDEHQIQYFSNLFGNKQVSYEGKSMKTAHKSLPLSDEHLKIFVELSQKALAQQGTNEGLINEVVKSFQTQRDEVISQ